MCLDAKYCCFKQKYYLAISEGRPRLTEKDACDDRRNLCSICTVCFRKNEHLIPVRLASYCCVTSSISQKKKEIHRFVGGDLLVTQAKSPIAKKNFLTSLLISWNKKKLWTKAHVTKNICTAYCMLDIIFEGFQGNMQILIWNCSPMKVLVPNRIQLARRGRRL